MKLKAKDTLHVSSVGAENLQPGQEFEVADDAGRQLVDRGLATEVKGKEAKADAKTEPAPTNKAEAAAPSNKAAISGAGRSKKKGK